MKNILLFLFLVCFFTGCNNQQPHFKKTVTTYFQARDASNYNKLKTVISDSINLIAGDYIMPYSRASFYEQFKWDSVFKPSYKIMELEEQNNQIIVSVSMGNIRNAFLKNNSMTCDYKISFTAGKISKIEELDCKNVDWGIWAQQRDSLVDWIKVNHPKLDGFVNDMTVIGAINYVQAIELYEAGKTK